MSKNKKAPSKGPELEAIARHLPREISEWKQAEEALRYIPKVQELEIPALVYPKLQLHALA